MEQQGWIKLHRKILDWEWFQDSHTYHLFTYLILSANHESKRWRGITIERGQLVTGRYKLSAQTGLSERKIRTCLERLIECNEISIKTTNRFSIITLCNYDSYQSLDNDSDQQTTNKRPTNDQQTTNKRPTNDQQTTTNKNDKNDNNDNNDKKPLQNASHSAGTKNDFIDKIISEFQESHGDYEIVARGKERKAAGALLSKYKKKYPGASSDEVLSGLRAFFDRCNTIDDNWKRDNMSLSLIVSQFNSIIQILKNGSSKGQSNRISDDFKTGLIARMLGENEIPPEVKRIKKLDQ
jgi:hypothetical protein